MKSAKRIYFYIASFVSLTAVVWAIIYLVRNLVDGLDRTDLAWQLAVIIFGLPFYLAHWIKLERVCRASELERRSNIRAFYLHAMTATLLGSVVTQLYRLLVETLQLVADVANGNTSPLDHLIALVFLGLIWLYHRRIPLFDRLGDEETPWERRFRQLVQWGFATAGLSILSFGVIEIMSALLSQFVESDLTIDTRQMINTAVRVVVGSTLWLAYWQKLQSNFNQNTAGERLSILRKIFLSLLMFIGLATFVGWTGTMWVKLLRGWLNVTDNYWRNPNWDEILPMLLVGGVVWAYHQLILLRDAQACKASEDQLTIRHISQYLVAALGLLATAVSISGILNLLAMQLMFGTDIDEWALTSFLATLLAGLPVWVVQWWIIQQRAVGNDEQRTAESRSAVRRIYLYLHMTIAGLVILSSGVYLIFRLLLNLLNVPDLWNRDNFAWAIAYGIVFAVVWVYHYSLAQKDSRRTGAERMEKLSTVRVAILESDIQGLTEGLQSAILSRMPKVQLDVVSNLARGEATEQTAFDVLVGSWQAMTNAENTARQKVVLPIGGTNASWVGVAPASMTQLIDDAAQKVETLVLDHPTQLFRQKGFGWIVTGTFGLVALIIVSCVFYWLF